MSNQPATQAERCSLELPILYDAIMGLQAGKGVVRVRGSDYRETEYTAANLPLLMRQYSYWWQMCGQGTSFPNLAEISGSSLVNRGGPRPVGDYR